MKTDGTKARNRRCLLALGILHGAILSPTLLMAETQGVLSAQSNKGVIPVAAKVDESMEATDQRLMEAERQLLQTLSARSLANAAAAKSVEKKPVEKKVVAATAPAAKDEPLKMAAVANVEAVVPSKPAPPKVSSAELEQLRTSNASTSKQLQTTQGRLRAAEKRIEELESELDQARSQLSMAETEVNRLSAIIDVKTRASLGKYNVPVPASAPRQAAPAVQRVSAQSREQTVVPDRINEVKPPATNADLQIATISVEKADLRLGPGRNHSALMSIPRGSRLVVEARQGEWYRVFAPNGERAWISASLVTFGDGASTLNDGSSVRVKGFNSNLEEEAFKRVQRMASGR